MVVIEQCIENLVKIPLKTEYKADKTKRSDNKEYRFLCKSLWF